MKKFFSFFAATLMAVTMSAETVTFTFKTDKDITYTATGTSGGGAKCEVSKGGVTLVGSDAYTDATKTLNVYAKSTLTVSVIGTVNKIDVEYNGKVYAFDEALGETTKGNKFAASGAHPASYTPETPAASIVLNNSNGGKTELLSLTVDYTPGEAVKVTGIALDKSELAMMGGDIVNLVATISPADASDKGIIWSTSDEKVATVSDGAVTAVGKGNATITAETKDGGYKATCAVSVSIKEAPEGAIFFETFDKMNGTGANDGTWSGTIASGAVAASDFDNEGWSTEGTLGKAKKSLCFRKNSSDANLPSGATTPALGKAGNGKVQFMAESWGTDGSNFFVDIVGEGSFVADENLVKDNISNEGKTAKVAMAKASKWTTFTLQFEGVTADSKIRFYAPAGKRAFMDEVAIWVEEAPVTFEIETDGATMTLTPSDLEAKYFYTYDYSENFETGVSAEALTEYIGLLFQEYFSTEEAYNAFMADNAASGILTANYIEDFGLEVGDEIVFVACALAWDGKKTVIASEVVYAETTVKEAELEQWAGTIAAGEENGTVDITPTDKSATYSVLAYSQAMIDMFLEYEMIEEAPTDPTEIVKAVLPYLPKDELTGDQTWNLISWVASTHMPIQTEGEWTVLVFGVSEEGTLTSAPLTYDLTVGAKEYTETITLTFDENGISATPSGEFSYVCLVIDAETAQEAEGMFGSLESYVVTYVSYGVLTIDKSGIYTATLEELDLEEGQHYAVAVGFDAETKEQVTAGVVATYTISDEPAGINNVKVENLGKMIVNGELVVVKDGVRYNVLGARK